MQRPKPRKELVHERLALTLPPGIPLFLGKLRKVLFQRKQAVAIPLRLFCKRACPRFFGHAFQRLVDLSADVRPAANHRYLVRKAVIPGIAVNVKVSMEILEKLLRMLRFSVRLVVI